MCVYMSGREQEPEERKRDDVCVNGNEAKQWADERVFIVGIRQVGEHI